MDTSLPNCSFFFFMHFTFREVAGLFFGLAFSCGNAHIIKMLLKHGADVNFIDAKGLTPMHCTLAKDEELQPKFSPCVSRKRDSGQDIMECLLACKANVNVTNGDGKTPLYLACKNGAINTIKTLLNHGADPNFSQFSPLIIACCRKYTEIINLLLSHSADPSVRWDGRTPLLIAADQCNEEIIFALLRYGADVNASDSGGRTALHLLVEHQNTSDKIIDIVDGLLKAGADVNVRISNWETPLYVACSCSSGVNVRLAELLLKNGANPDSHSHTLERLASFNPKLVCYGFGPGGSRAMKTPLLSLATILGDLELMSLLVENGADVDLRDADDKTPLYCAVVATSNAERLVSPSDGQLEYNISVISHLFSLGANPNVGILQTVNTAEKGDGEAVYRQSSRSPLCIAVNASNDDVVKLLLDHGAIVSAFDAS